MKHKYHTRFMENHLAISKIFDFIAPGSEVLDVGCSTGFLGSMLRKIKGCNVVGIDNDRAALRIAQQNLDSVIIADIENDEIKLRMEFDYIIFADVLEHTKNPEDVVNRFKRFLKHGGFILISVPNVAHPLVRLNLLLGRWNYTDVGIIDKTHLRFFTYKTAKEMLKKAGLKIVEDEAAGKFTIKKTFSAQFVFKCTCD